MTGRLAGKVALVTGAAQGQGAAHARMLALEGARVVATDIQKELGLHLVDDIVADGGEAVFAALDVTDPERWRSVVDMTVSTFGGLDVLINNAGIVTHSGALECSDEE